MRGKDGERKDGRRDDEREVVDCLGLRKWEIVGEYHVEKWGLAYLEIETEG